MGKLCEPYLCVTHGSRGVPVNGAEISLAVNEGIAHGKVLGHSHYGIIDGCIAMGVVFTNDISDNAGGFFIGPVVIVPKLMHGIKDAPVNGLKPVPNIWKGPSDDYAHGVIEIGPF